MGFVLIESSLSTSQRAIVLFPVLFDHTLERTVRNISVAGPKKQQVGEHARQPAVAVLKRVDRKKSKDEIGDDQKRMMSLSSKLPVRPRSQFLHQPRRFRRSCSFKNDADTPAMFIEGFNIIRDGLVGAAMVFIAGRKPEEDTVKLFDVVLRQRYLAPGIKHQLRRFRIAGDFLFVPGPE